MAEKLSVRIALEGGAEIERQLANIGKAGEKAFADIIKSAEQAGGFKKLKPEEVTSSLQKMGVTGVDAINKIKAAVQSAGRLESLVLGVQTLERGFAAAGTAALTLARIAVPLGTAIAAGIAVSTRHTIGFADALAKVSDETLKLGVSFKQFEQSRQSLQQAGISAEGFSSAMAKVKGDLDKFSLDQVAKQAKDLKASMAEGSFGSTSKEFRALQQAAQEFTPAGEAARKALADLGLGIPGTTKNDVKVLGTELAKLKGLGVDIKIGDDVATRLQTITDAISKMPDSAQRTGIAMQFLGEQAGTQLVQKLKAAEGGLSAQEAKAVTLRAAVTQLSDEWNRFGSVTFADKITSGVQLVTTALTTLKQALDNLSWDSFVNAGRAAFDLLMGFIRNFTLQGIATQIAEFAWDTFSKNGVAAFNAISGAIQTSIDWLKKWVGMKAAAPTGGKGGGAPAPALAGGGLLGGRGTGTSDSNLAWLSRGEYITPARAVRQPGVLAFLEALRRSGGNLSRVLDGMGRFALGGMVPRAIPAFANGGPVGRMSNVTIQFPGVPPIAGLRASSDVVEQLHKAAALAQVRSGGRKPSRYS